MRLGAESDRCNYFICSILMVLAVFTRYIISEQVSPPGYADTILSISAFWQGKAA